MHARRLDRPRRIATGHALLLAALALASPTAASQAQGTLPQGALLQGRAADEELVRESWTVSNGLPSNAVTRIVQTPDGYIWIATFNGLARFDGVRFTVFDAANTPGLPSARFVNAAAAADGTVWLVTDQRHLVRFRDGRATELRWSDSTIAGAIELLVDGDLVWMGGERGVGLVRGDRLVPIGRSVFPGAATALGRGPGRTLVVGDEAGRVVLLDTTGRIVRRFVAPPNRVTGTDGSGATTVRVDEEGTLLVGGVLGLWQGRVDRDSLEVVPLPALGIPVPSVIRISRRAPDGTRWIETSTGIIRCRNDQCEVAINAASFQWRPRLVEEGRSTWFAVDNVVHRDGRRVYTLPEELGDPLRETRISTMLVDREGSVWIGTEARGAHRLAPATFRTYTRRSDGLRADNIYSVTEDGRGRLWMNIWEHTEAARLDPATGRVDEIRLPVYVLTVLADGGDHVLAGGAFGLYRCTVDDPVRCERTGPPEAVGEEVVSLQRDARGTLWAGTRAAGLWRRDAGRWSRVAWAPRAPVRALVGTPDGATWFATNGAGLLRLDGDRVTRVTTRDGLPIDVLRSLHVDPTGMLWIGTEGRGLARLDPRAWGASPAPGADRRIAVVGRDAGLPDATIHWILDDDGGRLWLSTNGGIMRVALHELQAVADGRAGRVLGVTYTERDGLRNREGNGGYGPGAARTRDGRLWFPTQGGLAVVDPRRVGQGIVPSPPRVEAVVTRTRTVEVHDSTTIALDAGERDLEFRFTAPHFLEPTALRFRYRLDPYDADWIDAGTRRSAFYTRVPAGTYTFRVAVTDGRGRWQVATLPASFTIATQWTETGLARLFALASLVCLVAAAFRWRDTTLRRRAAELARLVDARTAALTASERELAARNAQLAEQAAALTEFSQARTRLFTYLSHEFRTPLTLILGPLQGLLEGRYGALPADAQAQGTLMQRNAQRLLRLVNQILDLARLQTGGVVLDRRRVDLVAFVRGVVVAFEPLAEQRGIGLAFESDRPALRAAVDAEQMEKVLLNLVGNALKFTPAAGRVVVRVDDDSFTARIVVEDTGIGIPPADLPHVFERFYRVADRRARRGEGTGIGLALVREVVELHGGHVSVESELGAGSRFIVGLPLEAAVRRGRAGEPEPITDPTRLTTGVVLHASGEFVAQVPPLLTDPRTGHALLDEAAVAEPADDAGGDRTTVLVVDDNADVRAWIRSILATTYRVLEAPDGARALALARVALPDLIVADVMMPELDGLGLARALRADEATDAIGIVLLTARAASAAQVEGYEAGADAYLVKPFEPSVLEACVAGLLAQRRRLRERFRADPRALAAAVARTEPTVTRETRVGDDGAVWEPNSAEEPTATEGDDGEPAMSALHAQLRTIVLERLTDPDLSPETLAAASGRSYHQLYRALQAEFGWSPSRFIRSVRVEYAAELLRQGKGSVTEVAYAVGFESLSYFGRAFRERFGANPGSFAAKGVSVGSGARGR